MGHIFVQVASSFELSKNFGLFQEDLFYKQTICKENNREWSKVINHSNKNFSFKILKKKFIGLSVKYTWKEVMKQLRWKTI